MKPDGMSSENVYNYANLLDSLKSTLNDARSIEKSICYSLGDILANNRHLSVEPKSVIYQEMSPAENCFYVKSGLVKLVTYLANGKAKITRICKPHSIFGLESVLDYPYKFYACSVTQSEIVTISKHQISALRQKDPINYSRFLESNYLIMQNDEKWNAEFTTGSIKARVSRILCYLTTFQGNQNSLTLINCDDIASLASASIESVSRILAEFKRSGVLTPIIIDGEIKYIYNLDLLLLYTTDDKYFNRHQKNHREQRRFRRSFINAEADLVIDDNHVYSATVRDYSRDSLFFSLKNDIPLDRHKNLMICFNKKCSKHLAKTINGTIIRKSHHGIALKFSHA